ncbi:MAG TPA: NIPSNAP family protein [candidate division Zixibacteria bacterium]|nr:NIPSNAP family protein [candidate division Zixibacteria bacterium]
MTGDGARPSGRVVEIRSYVLKPGTASEFERLFREESMPLLSEARMDVVAFGASLEDPDVWYLVRSFPDLDALARQEEAFYGSEAWRSGPREAVLACIETYTSIAIETDEATVDGLRRANPSRQV